MQELEIRGKLMIIHVIVRIGAYFSEVLGPRNNLLTFLRYLQY
jgi:hypothetical protein